MPNKRIEPTPDGVARFAQYTLGARRHGQHVRRAGIGCGSRVAGSRGEGICILGQVENAVLRQGWVIAP